MLRYHSMQLTGIVFQACSFNHSDISPFRINDCRRSRTLAQKAPSNPTFHDAICIQRFADAPIPSVTEIVSDLLMLPRSLTAISSGRVRAHRVHTSQTTVGKADRRLFPTLRITVGVPLGRRQVLAQFLRRATWTVARRIALNAPSFLQRPGSTVSKPNSSSRFVTTAFAAASSPAITSARRFFDPAGCPSVVSCAA